MNESVKMAVESATVAKLKEFYLLAVKNSYKETHEIAHFILEQIILRDDSSGME